VLVLSGTVPRYHDNTPSATHLMLCWVAVPHQACRCISHAGRVYNIMPASRLACPTWLPVGLGCSSQLGAGAGGGSRGGSSRAAVLLLTSTLPGHWGACAGSLAGVVIGDAVCATHGGIQRGTHRWAGCRQGMSRTLSPTGSVYADAAAALQMPCPLHSIETR
jgi:hypothetical protein